MQVKTRALIRFLVVGALNTLIGLVMIYVCKWFLGFGDAIANIIGYVTAVAHSFILNRRWTFGYAGPTLPALVRFLMVFAGAYLLNLVTVLEAIHLLGMNSYVAQALGIGPYTIFFYFGSRYFAFEAGRARFD